MKQRFTQQPGFRRQWLSQAILIALAAAPAARAQQAPAALGTVQAGASVGTRHADKTSQEKKITKKAVFKSGQSTTVLGQQEIDSAGAFAGSGQVLQLAPGVAVTGYGSSGSTKNQISVNGIKQGWGGFSGGQIDDGSISVTFDGVPMSDPSTGLWQTDLVPQMSLIQGIGVTKGPGDPEDRWFNNIGGQIAFVPVQPQAKAGGSVGISFGSDSSRGLHYLFNTGTFDGWSTVIAGGTSSSNSFRTTPDGFSSPASNEALFLKTRKQFQGGNFSVGFYNSRSTAFRPAPIPITNVPGLTLDGTNNTGYLSQQATGFYSAAPGSVWNKNDSNATRMLYGKINVAIDQNTTLHNLLWYQLTKRLHDHFSIWGTNADCTYGCYMYEHNNPSTRVYGDKLWADLSLPHNKISFGGFVLKSTYNTRNAFWMPNATPVGAGAAPFANGSQTLPNGNFRSNYFDQTDLALFAQDRIRPIQQLDVTPGIRFVDYSTIYSPGDATDFAAAWNLEGCPSGANCTAQGANSVGATASHHKFEPSISANYRVRPWLAAFGNYAITYKEPAVGGGGGLFQKKGSTFNLEKGTDYNVGFKIHVRRADYLHDFLLSLAYYHLHYSNQYIPYTVGTTYFDANGDSVYKGFDLSVSDRVAYNTTAFANMNFEKATFNNYTSGGPGSTTYSGLPVSNVPDRTLSAGVDYKLYAAQVLWDGALSYQYTGSQYIWSNLAGAPTNQQMPAYGVWNLQLHATVPVHEHWIRDWKFNVGVLNLLNKQYNSIETISTANDIYFSNNLPSTGFILADQGAPRTFYAGISADF